MNIICLSQQIYNIKEEIKEYNYLQIMNTLKNIYDSYNEDIDEESDNENNIEYIKMFQHIHNIKNEIKENDYLNIMNTFKDMYISYKLSIFNKSDESNEFDLSESDSNNEESISDDINYASNIVYIHMFEEYTCRCNTESYQCLCRNTLNLFRYCKNYQKIIDSFPDIQYIMNMHFYGIQSEYKIQFTREINLQDGTHDKYIFYDIFLLLMSLVNISRKYTKKMLVLIVINLVMKNFCHIINDKSFIFHLSNKLNEIIKYNNEEINDRLQYSDILILHGETIELIDYWLSFIQPFLN